MRPLVQCLLCCCFVATLAFAGGDSQTGSRVPVEHQRTTDQTFLTFPDWYLVYSPAEYAHFVKDRDPSDFPFWGHLGQFWQSYRAVHDATKTAYPFNFGYHVMIMVIGVSTTIEYALRSAYEIVIGRVAEVVRGTAFTEEDQYGAKVAQDYVDFIRIEPWYKYDFVDKCKRLWTETSLWGPGLFRKWERKYALTTEYLIKAAYGWLIKLGAETGYDTPIPVTAMVLDRWPPDAASRMPELKLLKQFTDGAALATAPRYQAFTTVSLGLAEKGVRFMDIAGNRTELLLTVLTPADETAAMTGTKTLFVQRILTEPSRKRMAWVVQVPDLSAVLFECSRRGYEIEHIYDY